MKLTERIILYLYRQGSGNPVPRGHVMTAAQGQGYTWEEITEALSEIEQTKAHIGQWTDMETKQRWCCYYEKNDLTRQVQECLDRGSNW